MNTNHGLPASWQLAPLADLLTGIETGKSFKCNERPPTADEVGVVKVSAVSWGEFQEEESKTCTTLGRVNPNLYIQRGDFLFSRANTVELVGACVITKQVNFRVMLSDKILRFQFVRESMKPWILNLLRSYQGRLQIEALASGNQDSMRNIGQERIGQILVPLPPAAEQTRIVEKLEELLSGLDAGVAELRAAQKKLTQYRQSLLKAAVEGALTADWRAAQGSGQPAGSAQSAESGQALLARILTERRSRWQARQLAKFDAQGKTPPKDWQAKYPEPVAPDTAGLPALPSGWVWTGLDQLLCELRSGTAETSGRDSTAYPVLKSSAVRQGTINFGALNYLQEEQSKRHDNFLQLGDVLITRLSGSVEYVGCCAVVKTLPDTQTQYPDRVFCGKLLPALTWLGDFIAICFQSAYARRRLEAAAKSTAGHKRISLSDLHGFPIPLPPLTEIHEIIKQVSESTEQIIDANLAVERGLKQSAAQRKNILNAAFSGQLVPQDPNDEPASALLARIRAERLDVAGRGKKRQGMNKQITEDKLS